MLLPKLQVSLNVVALMAAAAIPGNSGTLNFSVSFDDPTGLFSSFYAPITSHALAAGADWGRFILGRADLEIVVRFNDAIPRATGRSTTTAFVRNNGRFDVFEQGAAAEIRTGIDPNGADPDIEIVFNSDYLFNELWFDPDPVRRLEFVPSGRTDAASVFLHELGHAFAFNGFLDPFTGAHFGIGSTFDEFVTFDGSNLFFEGSRASSIYGGPIPLTSGNYLHFGNITDPGVDLIPDLMNGVFFFRGNRYRISPLDVALFADVGVTVVPEPATSIILLSGGIVLFVLRRLKSRQ